MGSGSLRMILLAALAAAGGIAAASAAADPPPAATAAASQRERTGREVGRMPRVKPIDRRQARLPREHLHETPRGMYGPYPPTRESSGTSWQPESSAHEGLHATRAGWSTMLHGWASAVYDRQDGPRGDERFFGASMLMGLAQRSAGPGTLGLRAMMSAEAATIGRRGYPLLLQTGESADGVTPLRDRQHPHDLFMELAAAYSVGPAAGASAFVYAGLPGEPALGPPVFMHRLSGSAFPDAPIGHHWLDSSHITYGVLTAGLVDGPWKLEASRFRGREPDHVRTDIEEPELDSHSFRLSLNPNADLALQASHGRIESPEALEPGVDVDRTTASAILNRSSRGRARQTMVAWGRNHERPGRRLDAFLFETAERVRGRHVWLARVEQVEKDELLPPADPRAGRAYTVEKFSVGYVFEGWPRPPVATALGALASLSRVPGALESAYGSDPLALMVFVRARLR